MKTFLQSIAGVFTAILLATTTLAKEPTSEQSAYLKAYHELHEKLAEDDLDDAKEEAEALAEKAEAAKQPSIAGHARQLAKSTSLDAAREHFKAISAESIKMAADLEDQHVFHCPMAKADWLQTDRDKVVNPYMGKKMLECGSLKKS